MRFLIVLISFLLLFPLTLAQPYIKVEKSEVEALTGRTTHLTIQIQNLGNERDVFKLVLWPDRFDDVFLTLDKYLIALNASGSANVTLSIYPATTAREATYSTKLMVTSIYTNEKTEKELTIRIKRQVPVMISRSFFEKNFYYPNETLKLLLELKNFAFSAQNATLRFEILLGNKILKSKVFEVEIPGRESLNFTFSMPLEKFAPGNYKVRGSLIYDGKLVNLVEKDFGVARVVEFEVKKSERTEFLSQVFEYSIKNVGNDLATYELKVETKPYLRYLLSYSKEPEFVEADGKTFLVWKISLKPDESTKIYYRINYLPLILLILFLAILVYVMVRKTFELSISKFVTYKGPLVPKKTIRVLIEVKNKKRSPVKNVLIEDLVPPILKVVEKFETLKPEVKKVPEGTRLIWKIANLHPDEERVLSYYVTPMLHVVGTIKLPAAKIHYTIKKRRKVKVSNRATIKGE